ncbi:hypothetical protein J7L06_05995 [Candidatus Bathyarchaeota archaeon]|nr:hypothetical protein [Candidatus Bathyarchaeota archaeon]
MSKGDVRVVEVETLLIMLAFGFLNGCYTTTLQYLPLILRKFGYTTFEVGISLSIIQNLFYVVHPCLLFVTLYYVASEKLLKRISSTLVSLIVGSFVGYWLGALTASMSLTNLSFLKVELKSVLSTISVTLFNKSLLQFIVGIAATTLPQITRMWDNLITEGFQKEKPKGVLALSLLYVCSGLLTLLVFPLTIILPVTVHLFFQRPFFGVSFTLLILMGAFSQILVGMGLYRGRRWGWFLSFIFSIVSLLTYITNLASLRYLYPLTIIVYTIAFLLNLTILIYLFQQSIRRYFRIIDPTR